MDFLQFSHARNKGFPNSDWHPTLSTYSTLILPKLWKFDEIWPSSFRDMSIWILGYGRDKFRKGNFHMLEIRGSPTPIDTPLCQLIVLLFCQNCESLMKFGQVVSEIWAFEFWVTDGTSYGRDILPLYGLIAL